MKQIVIHGAYDTENFGDVLLADLAVQHVNSLGCVSILSGTTDKIVAQLAGNCSSLRGLSQGAKADGLIYGGGGYWGEPHGNVLRWHLSRGRKHLPIGLLFKYLGRPFACIGPGFGPLKYQISRLATTRLFNSASVVALRDQESMDYFLQYGGVNPRRFTTADMALVINRQLIEERQSAAPSHRATDIDNLCGGAIGIHTNDSLSSTRHRQFLEHVKSAARAIPTARFVVFRDNSYRSPEAVARLNEVAEYVGANCRVASFNSHWEICQGLSAMAVVLTKKLHVGIVSSALGKTVLAMPNHPKTKRFYKQIERPECCLENQSPEIGRQIMRGVAGEIPPIRVPASVLAASQKNYELITEFVSSIS